MLCMLVIKENKTARKESKKIATIEKTSEYIFDVTSFRRLICEHNYWIITLLFLNLQIVENEYFVHDLRVFCAITITTIVPELLL